MNVNHLRQNKTRKIYLIDTIKMFIISHKIKHAAVNLSVCVSINVYMINVIRKLLTHTHREPCTDQVWVYVSHKTMHWPSLSLRVAQNNALTKSESTCHTKQCTDQIWVYVSWDQKLLCSRAYCVEPDPCMVTSGNPLPWSPLCWRWCEIPWSRLSDTCVWCTMCLGYTPIYTCLYI
jgi:hypothetical protein